MSMADQFEPLEVIGRGSFGLIRKVRHKSDKKILARKEISYRQMNVKEKNQLMAEFRILKSLVYPNIVRYYYHDHIVHEHVVHLYMEYCDGGDLAGVIRTCKQSGDSVPESLVWSIFTQLTLALYRCHYNSDPPPPDEIGSNTQTKEPPVPSTIILHRDIKPDNVFLDQHNTVKLGDFGLAKILDQEHVLANTYVGTPYYMSPEVLNDQPSMPQSDVWSLGCVIYELCAKHPPFQAKSHMQLSQRIKEGTYPPLPAIYSDLLGSTIASCLTQDYRARPTTAVLLHTSMFNFCRKEREVESLQRDLEDAKLDIDQARLEIEESRNHVEMTRNELDNRECILKSQEEELMMEREELLKEVQIEQESIQLQMKAFNEEFEQRVDQEVQRRVDMVIKGKRSSLDHSLLSQHTGTDMKQGRSETSMYSQSSLLDTPVSISSAQFSNESIATSVQSTQYVSRSGVKGPRLIRDSSLNSNKSRSPQKHFTFDDDTGNNFVSKHRLERKLSGQSLASHASHGSHATSISRMGSNASAGPKITSPMMSSHHSFEQKQYSSSQQSQRKPSGSQIIQQSQHGQNYILADLSSSVTIKPGIKSSPEKDTEATSPGRQCPLNTNSQSRHIVQLMDDSSNSSISAYSLHSSRLSASSASSVETEGNNRLSSDFSKQALVGYHTPHPYSQQGQIHNLHVFETNQYPTRSVSTKTEGYMRTKNDIQFLDDSSVTTLQDIHTQQSVRQHLVDDEDEYMANEPKYGSFKPKRSISSPVSSSAHTIRVSPQKSAASLAMMIEAQSSSPLSRMGNGNGNVLTGQQTGSNRGSNRKSPPGSFNLAVPRERQAPHFQAIYSTPGSGDRSTHNSPEKDISKAHSPLLDGCNSFGNTNPVPLNAPVPRHGNVKIARDNSRSPVYYEAAHEVKDFSKNTNSAGSSPRKRSPTRKPVRPGNKTEDLSEFSIPKSDKELHDPRDTYNTSPPSSSCLVRRRGANHGRVASYNRNTTSAPNLNGTAAVDTNSTIPPSTRKEADLVRIGIKTSAPTSRERNGIVAAGFVKRRCETWDENWNIKGEPRGEDRDVSPSPFVKRHERRV